ncbi:hypothetical protein BY996DRAFT_2468274 [Phakopsora pachyrhizi]|nr:hypothetical protein BY996DRAFT_2468274 [Phakopsora pachyrhizi]
MLTINYLFHPTERQRLEKGCGPSTLPKPMNFKVNSRSVKQKPLTAYQRKIQEAEAVRQIKTRRETEINLLSIRMIESLLQIGDRARDVERKCCSVFNWEIVDWQRLLKDGQVMIYEPSNNDQRVSSGKSKRKIAQQKVNLGSCVWSEELETIGLSLLILKSMGELVQLKYDRKISNRNSTYLKGLKSDASFREVEDCSSLRCIFVHRNFINEFLYSKIPSIIELVRNAPRIQIFAFGSQRHQNEQENKITAVELILRAGAIILPTFDALFNNQVKEKDSDSQPYYKRLQHMARVNPFVTILLIPTIRQRCFSTKNKTGDICVESLIDFLGEMKMEESSVYGEERTLKETIQRASNSMDWINHPKLSLPADVPVDELSEVSVLGKILVSLRKEMYKDFRRFIITVSSEEKLLKGRLNFNQEQIEIIEIGKLCKILEAESF